MSSNVSLKTLISQSAQALRQADYPLAIELADEVLAQNSDHAGALAVRFSSLFKSQQFERARRMGGQAAAANPKSVFILNNQACLQLEAKQPAAAAGLLKSLIDQFGEQSQWLYNLALAQRMVGNYERAIVLFRSTLDHQVDHDKAAFQLADCLKLVGKPDQAVEPLNTVRLLRSKHAPSHSDYISTASANNAISSICLEQEMTLWGERFIPPDNRYQLDPIKDLSAVKIGFIVGELLEGWFQTIVEPVITALADGADTVFVYHHNQALSISEVAEGVEKIDCSGLSDADFAHKVRGHEIEVLIDLCGMRAGNRQRALGLQLAGRQFSWLGHEGYFATKFVTSLEDALGIKQYAFAKPAKSANVSSNFLLTKQSTKLAESTLPAQSFAAVGIELGLSDQVLKVWAHILKHSAGWTLNLPVQEDHVRKSFIERFSELDIAATQLSFVPSATFAEDTIVLDNFVRNGLVECFKALENQCALVTLRGPLFAAQRSAALLEQVGLQSDICASPYEYQTRAIKLASGEIDGSTLAEEKLNKSGCRDTKELTARIRDIIVRDSKVSG